MSKFKVLITIFIAILAPLTANAAEPDNYFYVNSYENTAAWTGSSNIYDYLHVQDAIKDAATWSATNSNKEAYVLLAVGSYRLNTTGGIANSLSLKDGVTVIGGFKGTETDTIPTYKQSDDPTGSTTTTSIRANDEIPVFVNTGVGPAAGLQNVVVSYGSGYNNGRDCGGGMDNTNSSPTITNCTFLNNITNGNGGSMRNDNSSPTVTNCTFTFNTTQSQAVNGGGIYNTNGSSPTLKYCTFTNNIAGGSGGGMYSDGSNPTLINCSFTGNKANGSGGGVNINSGSATLINCTFTNDTTATYGGGINVATGGSATLINCVAMGNKADTGGAMNIDSGTLINCTVLSNTANNCGGVCTYQTSTLINCLVALNNNSNSIANNLNSTATTIQASVIGWTAYDKTSNTSTITSPALTDFNSDGSLTSYASYAIKQGAADLYETEVNSVLTTLNGAGNLPSTATDMLDINGLSVIDANDMIDIGAFRRPGTVTGVTVKPGTAMLRKGQTTTFTATVDAQDGAGQRVIWSVNSTAGSTIDSNGLLTIATGETATTLTVTATSVEDKTKSGTATVTVLDIPPAVTTVTANAGYGGTVDNGGSGLTYTVKPSTSITGYVIDQVFVDGVEQTVSNRSTFTYTFNDDGGTHSIFATFGYTVNFNMPTNGTLTVSSADVDNLSSGTLVHGGQVLTTTVTPDNGYVLESLTVNSADVANDYDNGYDYTVGTSGAKRTLSDGVTEISAQGADIAATFHTTGGAGIDSAPQAKMLQAWTGSGQLHVSGLTIGNLWAVYDISGSQIYQSQATGEKAEVNLRVQGVYVVVSGAERVKVVCLN